MNAIAPLRAQAVVAPLSVGDCVVRLDALTRKIAKYRDQMDATHNPMAVFCSTYVDLTAGISSALKRDPRFFENPAMIVQLAESFAERFFDGMNAALALRPPVPFDADFRRPVRPGVPPPLPWIEVAKHAQQHPTLVLEDLLYGIVVHIGYDLPVVLSGMDLSNPAFQRDFQRFNQVLEDRTAVVEKDIGKRYGQGIHVVDVLAGHLDEKLTDDFLRSIRNTAMQNAGRLRTDPRVMGELMNKVRGVLALSDMSGTLGDAARFFANLTRRWPVARAA